MCVQCVYVFMLYMYIIILFYYNICLFNLKVPDVFPLLRYAELHPRQQPHVQREEKVERKKNIEERKFSGSLTANPGDQSKKIGIIYIHVHVHVHCMCISVSSD